MRDDFPEKTKEILAKRVGMICSNPKCRKPTSGPRDDPMKAVNIGVGAHITAASPGGPRYDASLSESERASATNGIWLCQNCAKLVDNDEDRYSANLLRDWKESAERAARDGVEAHGKSSSLSTRGSREARIDKGLIVVIEDDDAFRLILAEILREEFRKKFQVMVFGSADDGLHFLLNNAPRVRFIVLDMMMRLPIEAHEQTYARGLETGMWVLQQAKQVVKSYRIPIVVISAAFKEAIEPQLSEFNADTHPGLVDYLSKPLVGSDFRALCAMIRERTEFWGGN
jgi:CheY-like chemotaxis protein